MSGPWLGSAYRVYIALQDLQAIVLMLHRRAFWLSGKVVALQLDNSTAEVYICNNHVTL